MSTQKQVDLVNGYTKKVEKEDPEIRYVVAVNSMIARYMKYKIMLDDKWLLGGMFVYADQYIFDSKDHGDCIATWKFKVTTIKDQDFEVGLLNGLRKLYTYRVSSNNIEQMSTSSEGVTNSVGEEKLAVKMQFLFTKRELKVKCKITGPNGKCKLSVWQIEPNRRKDIRMYVDRACIDQIEGARFLVDFN